LHETTRELASFTAITITSSSMRTEVLMLVLLFVVDVVRAFVPAAAALAPRSYTAAAARSTAAAIVPRSTAVAVEDDEMVDDKVN
jgi:hypothetical protein